MEGMGGRRVDVNGNNPAFVLWTFGAISMENGLCNLMVLLQTSTEVSGSNSAILVTVSQPFATWDQCSLQISLSLLKLRQ